MDINAGSVNTVMAGVVTILGSTTMAALITAYMHRGRVSAETLELTVKQVAQSQLEGLSKELEAERARRRQDRDECKAMLDEHARRIARLEGRLRRANLPTNDFGAALGDTPARGTPVAKKEGS